MSFWLPALFSLFIGIAGWHYLFFSRAAHRLTTIENQRANYRRVVLRRTNGFAMILLAVLLYLGCTAIDPQTHPRQFATAWFAVFLLLLAVVVLALLDIRLTVSLRRKGVRKEKS